jgi:HSP20 family protein
MTFIQVQPRVSWWHTRPAAQERVHQEIERLLDNLVPEFTGWEHGFPDSTWQPKVDIYESADALLVKADLPGVKKEDLTVTVQGNLLSLKGEKKEAGGLAASACRSERRFGSFQRVLTLPADVDATQVQAVYSNGVLSLTLPKKEEFKPKQIRIDVQ